MKKDKKASPKKVKDVKKLKKSDVKELVSGTEPVQETKKPKNPRKKKPVDTEQFVRVPIKAGDAPAFSVVFINNEGWKINPKTSTSVEGEVSMYRLLQAGGNEQKSVKESDEVMIPKGYLDKD